MAMTAHQKAAIRAALAVLTDAPGRKEIADNSVASRTILNTFATNNPAAGVPASAHEAALTVLTDAVAADGFFGVAGFTTTTTAPVTTTTSTTTAP